MEVSRWVGWAKATPVKVRRLNEKTLLDCDLVAQERCGELGHWVRVGIDFYSKTLPVPRSPFPVPYHQDAGWVGKSPPGH